MSPIKTQSIPIGDTTSRNSRESVSADEQEQREGGISNLHYCSHGLISFHCLSLDSVDMKLGSLDRESKIVAIVSFVAHLVSVVADSKD